MVKFERCFIASYAAACSRNCGTGMIQQFEISARLMVELCCLYARGGQVVRAVFLYPGRSQVCDRDLSGKVVLGMFQYQEGSRDPKMYTGRPTLDESSAKTF